MPSHQNHMHTFANIPRAAQSQVRNARLMQLTDEYITHSDLLELPALLLSSNQLLLRLGGSSLQPQLSFLLRDQLQHGLCGLRHPAPMRHLQAQAPGSDQQRFCPAMILLAPAKCKEAIKFHMPGLQNPALMRHLQAQAPGSDQQRLCPAMVLLAPAQCSSTLPSVVSSAISSSTAQVDSGIQPSCGIFKPRPQAAISSASALPWSFLRLHSAAQLSCP